MFNHTCITFHSDLLSFELSNNYCQAIGKRLAQSESQEKSLILKSATAMKTEFWIGLHSPNSNATGSKDFTWLYQDPRFISSNYTNWEKFTPVSPVNPYSGQCITMKSDSMLWNNRACQSLYPFMCQQGKEKITLK